MKHTPGPWAFVEYHGTAELNALAVKHGLTPVLALSNEGQRFIMTIGDEPKRVALVDSQTSYKRGKGHQSVAAAPSLLKELSHLVSLLEGWEDTLNVPGLATLNGARNAIALATGTARSYSVPNE